MSTMIITGWVGQVVIWSLIVAFSINGVPIHWLTWGGALVGLVVLVSDRLGKSYPSTRPFLFILISAAMFMVAFLVLWPRWA